MQLEDLEITGIDNSENMILIKPKYEGFMLEPLGYLSGGNLMLRMVKYQEEAAWTSIGTPTKAIN